MPCKPATNSSFVPKSELTSVLRLDTHLSNFEFETLLRTYTLRKKLKKRRSTVAKATLLKLVGIGANDLHVVASVAGVASIDSYRRCRRRNVLVENF